MAPGTSRMRATISIGPRRFAGQLLIWSQNRLKSVKDVLLCLLTRTTLAHGSWHLKDARHDPTLLIRALKGDREIDSRLHLNKSNAFSAYCLPHNSQP